MEETSKHCVLGRHQTCSKEGIEVLSDAIERHRPLQYTPSLLYPEGYQDGNWRNHIRKKVYELKMSLRDNLMKELGSEVAGQAESSQPTQPNPNPIHRIGRLVMTEQTSSSSTQEINTSFSRE